MDSMCAEYTEILIEKYGNSVYRFALSLTRHKDIADDIFQEVFLRCFKKQPIFDSDEHAKAWFFTVTRNCACNHFTSAFIRHRVPLAQDFPFLEKEEYGLYEEVMKLPLKYRVVIHLYYYEEYSTLEIANILNKKDTTIRTQLKRARTLLKYQLEGSEKNEEL